MYSKARFEMWPPDQAVEKLGILTSRLSNPCIGKVILASGYRKNKDNQRLDWALIESPDTFTRNKPPPESSLVGAFVDLPSDDPYLRNQDPVVREVSGVQAGDWVIKRGRSTGVTSGFVNCMKRDINWLSLGFASEEWEVLTNYAQFAHYGDSGSIVTNARGELVGLIFAQDVRRTELTAGFFTPFSAIQDDVKELTGGGFLSLD